MKRIFDQKRKQRLYAWMIAIAMILTPAGAVYAVPQSVEADGSPAQAALEKTLPGTSAADAQDETDKKAAEDASEDTSGHAEDAQNTDSRSQTEPAGDPQQEETDASGQNSSEAAREESDVYVSDEIIVVYDDADTTNRQSERIQEKAEQELADAEIEVTEQIAESTEEQGTIAVAEIPEGQTVEEAVKEAKAQDNVSYAQPNFIYRLLENDVKEQDTADSEPVGEEEINDIYQDNAYHLEQTKTKQAWRLAKSNKTVTVAVLDTGCRYTHEDLKNTVDVEHAYDAYHDVVLRDSPLTNKDGDGHGTHVCGLIGAEANNGKGIAGTSYNANILPIKVFDDQGDKATTDSVITAYQYCMALIGNQEVPNLRVINLSMGYYPDRESVYTDRVLKNMIATMRDEYQVLSVCAGGNGDLQGNPITQKLYPSDFDECLSVTALTQAGNDCYWSDYNQYKDISAPGENIYSTIYYTNNAYGMMDGTSMAAPIVSGICALLWAKQPDLTVDQVVDAIESTATEVNHRGRVTGSHGAINAYAALEKVDSYQVTGTGQKNRISIEHAEVSGISSAYTYRNTYIKPGFSVCLNGKLLSANHDEGGDYIAVWSRNKNVGTATVTIKGIGSYSGSITKSFTIKPALLSAVSCKVSSTTYTGSARKPAVTVKSGTATLKNGTDYTLTYSNNTKVGKGKVVIKGKGNFTGTVTKTFKINPKGTNISKLTKKSKAFQVKWKKQAVQTSGYQIQYSRYKSFKSAKTLTISKTKTTSKTVKKLEKKKTYYVRVRTYKTVSGTKYYSGWSAVKSVKTK